MENWKEMLADVDDDYLIGISNKGIVKRAYKDKMEAETAAVIGEMGDEASVKVGEETVKVRFPLGESKCSCPSRSICRHVVQAILVLKENCCGSAEGGGPETGATVQGAEGGDPEKGTTAQGAEGVGGGTEITAQGTEGGTSGTGTAQSSAIHGAANLEGAAQAETQKENGEAANQGEAGVRKTAAEKVCKEIDEYPFARLQKALGIRQLQILYNQRLAGIKPNIQYTSIVTVQLPEQGTVVKLLSPLDYSSCTCHKKDLCIHKAAAILWCKLESGALKEEDLGVGAAENPQFEIDKVGDAAELMKGFLEELFCTGLSRTSPDVLDYLERLAIISHNAGLARFEGYFRALSDSYGRYFQRKAIFRAEELMEQITRLYKRVRLLEEAVKSGDSGEVLKQAGEFRADYIPVGNLDLIGITMEHFQTQTGYEGETIYFLEEHKKQWYTYTNARPMFYDTGKNRRSMERSQAPWGLNIAIADMAKVRIHLTGAKCDARNRLSSTQETKGEIMGEQALGRFDIEEWYYDDFEKLFLERIEKPRQNWLYGPEEQQKGVELVFLQPDSCVKAEFSQSGQQLYMPLFDRAGREVVIEMAYSKQEASSIRYLERISEKKPSCFLGKIYLRDGRIRMYPVTVFKKFAEW